MHQLITTGHGTAPLQDIEEVLRAGGLRHAASPLPDQRRVEHFSRGVMRSLNVDLRGGEPMRQLTPGAMWHKVAADILYGNLDSELWGWSDPDTSWLIEFWLGFDANCRGLLVYSPPWSVVTWALEHGKESEAELLDLLEEWHRWNSELLRLATRHPAKLALVNGEAALQSQQELLVVLERNLGVGLSFQSAAGSPRARDELLDYLARQAIIDQPRARELYEELESVAHFPASNGTLLPFPALRACRSQFDALRRQSRCTMEAQQRISELSLQAARAEARLAQSTTIERAQLVKLEAMARDYELMSIQTQQLQSALEVLDQAVSPMLEFTVDLREEIIGENWYWAEHDGRWAGPMCSSALVVPAMPRGAYELSLVLQDSMEPAILAGMAVSVDGCPVRFDLQEPVNYPLRLIGHVELQSSPAGGAMHVCFGFPAVRSPSEAGSDDRRLLAIRLQSLGMRRLPASGHATTMDQE